MARWGSPNDDDVGSALPEFKEAGAQGGERRIEMLKIPGPVLRHGTSIAFDKTNSVVGKHKVTIPVRDEHDALEIPRFGKLQRFVNEAVTVQLVMHHSDAGDRRTTGRRQKRKGLLRVSLRGFGEAAVNLLGE